MAQPVKGLTLDLSSGHGPTVHEFEPCIGLRADSVETAWDSLSLSSFSVLLPITLCLFLSK